MTILLTGSTGFIGKRVKALLADRDVVCFAGDLAEPKSYRGVLQAMQPRVCLHLAWLGLPNRSAKMCWRNVSVMMPFFDALVEANCFRVVAAGSCFEYGEQAEGAVTEDTEPRGMSDFGRAKRWLSDAMPESRWARIFYAYPNRLTSHAEIGFERDGAFGADNPEMGIDAIHVDDVARGLVALLDADCESGVYNLGSGQPRAVGEVVNAIAKRFGKPEPYPGIKATSGFWADMTKTKAATGFECQVPFEP